MFSSLILIFLLQGKRRECLDELPTEENIFAPEHYGEVGYARDVCVELGRNLIRKLQLPDATQPCQDLALTRTSTCWPFMDCDKWNRKDGSNKAANEKVLRRALRMVKDFNDHVTEYPVISNIDDQKFIWRSVGIAANRLIKSGAVDKNSELVGEIYKLRFNYCQQYNPVTLREAFQKEDEEENRTKNEQVKYIYYGQPMSHEDDKRKRPDWDEYKETDKPRVTLREAFQKEDEEENRTKNEQVKYMDYGRPMSYEEDERKRPDWDEYEETAITKEIEIEILEGCKSDTEQEISSSEDEQGELLLHESVFRGNLEKFIKLLNKGYDVTKKDKHGNTALHLAAMLGREDFIEPLLKFNPPTRSRNLLGWSAMDEAVSYGKENIVKMILPTFNRQPLEGMAEKRKQLLLELENTKDFYLEMRWDFNCWIPGISYLLPSDLCKIRKRGSSIRMDTTLTGFDETRLRYKRGSLSFLFDGKSSPSTPVVYYMNNVKKDYTKIDMKLGETNSSDAKNMLKNYIPHLTMSRSCITFKRLTKWIRLDRTIGRFKAQYYEVENMVIKFQTRSEHFSKRRSKKKEAEMASMKNFVKDALTGKVPAHQEPNVSQDENDEIEPVPPCKVTWEQYINSAPGKYPTLARPMVIKEQTQHIKTTVGMSKELELPVVTFVKILEVLAPFKHFDKVREFLQLKLPEGFPVKLEIPLIPTLSARITFPDFKYCTESEEELIPEHLFKIPQDYKKLELV